VEVFRVVEVNKDNFEDEIVKSQLPAVVDLWGPKCGPCLALMPKVEELASGYDGKLKFGKLNVAENRRLCATLRVMGVPTFLFYKGGEIKSRLSGDDVTIESIRENAEGLL
jgi:thioredoxin 1